MALKKDYPEAFAKLRDAQKMIVKAVVGGLLDDLGAHYWSFKANTTWTLYGGGAREEQAREACRRLRTLLPEGVRILWEEGQDAHKATLSVETGDGRLTARAGSARGTSKYAEG